VYYALSSFRSEDQWRWRVSRSSYVLTIQFFLGCRTSVGNEDTLDPINRILSLFPCSYFVTYVERRYYEPLRCPNLPTVHDATPNNSEKSPRGLLALGLKLKWPVVIMLTTDSPADLALLIGVNSKGIVTFLT
jgi:hypothetical protein